MEKYFIFIAIGITVVTVPITTLISLWVKWKWENPKIYSYISTFDHSANRWAVEPKLKWRRYKLSKINYMGLYVGGISGKYQGDFYLLRIANEKIYIPKKANFDKQPKRLKELIGEK